MTDLLQDKTTGNITLADIDSGVREARRLRSEEIHRLLGVANMWVRKEINEFFRYAKRLGTWLIHKLETMTLRHQQTRVHYD
ncbi:hypothetical protein J0X12_03990 [Sneathiella sp. CAU 1612]|uniref:Uncharacterized protein n=1 Tax=Sneathiella sedimenti TaxID=2816034 RepID=A0ABS3F2L9_9PROT|nr:hypothetical protein [Sneathiella sedimenti]MBO0332761.1 hypothetical protein [Sneathiella sedimenti]